ncbi:MAG: hypothetical protein IKM46_08310 [Clostridia bacterium]|nr:hypothetical protein [Clostridia bacterium]
MSESKVSKKQQACVNRYIDKAYDRINLTMPKGNKEVVSEHAKKRGESVNSFINRAILETIERDKESFGGQKHELSR